MVSFIHWLPFLLILADARRPHFLKTFNVLSYGARPDRITDNSMVYTLLILISHFISYNSYQVLQISTCFTPLKFSDLFSLAISSRMEGCL